MCFVIGQSKVFCFLDLRRVLNQKSLNMLCKCVLKVNEVHLFVCRHYNPNTAVPEFFIHDVREDRYKV